MVLSGGAGEAGHEVENPPSQSLGKRGAADENPRKLLPSQKGSTNAILGPPKERRVGMAIVQPGSCKYKVEGDRVEVIGDQPVASLSCPKCGGRLGRRGWHWRMVIIEGRRSRKHRIRLRRVRCKGCGGTHVVFPCFLAPYRRVISALWQDVVKRHSGGMSLRKLADETGFSLDTVRRWVRRAADPSLQVSADGAG